MALLYGQTATGAYVRVQVTEDGQIVSVTDSAGVTVGWEQITGKPDLFPSDWGIIGSKPATFPSDWDTTADKPTTFPSTWADVSGKPTTFPSTWGEVSGKPLSFPSNWNDVSGKPSVFPTDWSLVANPPTVFPSDWGIIGSKPATFPSDWDTTADKPTTFPSTWADVSGKPATFPPSGTVTPWQPRLESLIPAGTVTYSLQSGTSYQIGQLVYVTCALQLASHSGQSGRLHVRGMPVLPGDFNAVMGGVMPVLWDNYIGVSNSTLSYYGGIRLDIDPTAFVFLRVRQGASQTDPTVLNWADISQTFGVRFVGVYLSA